MALLTSVGFSIPKVDELPNQLAILPHMYYGDDHRKGVEWLTQHLFSIGVETGKIPTGRKGLSTAMSTASSSLFGILYHLKLPVITVLIIIVSEIICRLHLHAVVAVFASEWPQKQSQTW